MSWHRIVEKYLRGWLPKDPIMPDSRLKAMRKPVAVLVTATLLVASFSLVYFYTAVPRPLPHSPPEPMPTNSPATTNSPISSPTPSQSPTQPTQTPETEPKGSPGPSPSKTSVKTPDMNYPITITPVTSDSSWTAINRVEIHTYFYDSYHVSTPIYCYPSDLNSLFLSVWFNESVPLEALPIDAREFVVEVDGTIDYEPCGFQSTVWSVGDFHGMFSTNQSYVISTSTSSGYGTRSNYQSSHEFAYEIPIAMLNGQHTFEFRVGGSPEGNSFVLQQPLPTSAPRPSPTPTPYTPVGLLWQKTYGGRGDEAAYSVVQTTDGGYILAGSTTQSGIETAEDLYLVKTDANGVPQWNKTYPRPGCQIGYQIIRTTDGGYAVAGYTDSGAGSDMWLCKVDGVGNMQWNKVYGGSGQDVACSLVQSSDGGYVLAGYTNSSGAGSYDVYAVKTDSNGNIQWNKTFGGAFDERGYSIALAADGGYAIVGESIVNSDGVRDTFLVKISGGGNPQWQKQYDSINRLCGGNNCGFSVIQTSDGGYAIAGREHLSFPFSYEDYLAKVNSDGEIEWTKNYHRTDYSVPNTKQGANCVIQTSNREYAMISESQSYNYAYLTKTDTSGYKVWDQTYGGTGNDIANCLILTSDGNLVIAGSTTSSGAGGYDFWLLKIDPEAK
jgi:hypothetical protein